MKLTIRVQGPVPILWCVAFLGLDNEDSGPKVASCKGLTVRQRESHNRDFSVALDRLG